MDLLRYLQNGRQIIPVAVIDDAANALELGQALVDGGIPIVEITFRTPCAAEAIEAIATRGDVLVGAGTVTTPEQVDTAVVAGATFVVSPGLSKAVLERCRHHGVIAIPGAVTSTEIMALLELGITTVKFFPAEAAGGISSLRALSAPFPDVRFIPTGGVNPSNASSYLELPNVVAVGGSWMLPRDCVRMADFEEIRRLVRESTGI